MVCVAIAVSLFAGVTRAMKLKLLESQAFPSGVVALRYEPDREPVTH